MVQGSRNASWPIRNEAKLLVFALKSGIAIFLVNFDTIVWCIFLVSSTRRPHKKKVDGSVEVLGPRDQSPSALVRASEVRGSIFISFGTRRQAKVLLFALKIVFGSLCGQFGRPLVVIYSQVLSTRPLHKEIVDGSVEVDGQSPSALGRTSEIQRSIQASLLERREAEIFSL